MLRCFIDLESVNWEKLIEYADRMREKVLYNQLGFVFDLLGDKVKTPRSFLLKVEKKLSSNIYYFEKRRKGQYVEKWKVIVDLRLEKIVEGV